LQEHIDITRHHNYSTIIVFRRARIQRDRAFNQSMSLT